MHGQALDGFTSASEDITGLAAGDYDLTVTDANGCVLTCNNNSRTNS